MTIIINTTTEYNAARRISLINRESKLKNNNSEIFWILNS